MTRHNFTLTQQKDMRKRSNDVCEGPTPKQAARFTRARRAARGPCGVPSCDRGGIINAGGIIACNRHYQAWKRYGGFQPPTKEKTRDCICSQCGTPFDMGYAFVRARRKNVFCSPSCRKASYEAKSRADEAKRFWKFVDVRGENECWPWKGQINEHGYGCFRPASGIGSPLATRKSLEFKLGRPIKEGMLACHTCDNPPCVNPGHLYEGTRSDNLNDFYNRVKYKDCERMPPVRRTEFSKQTKREANERSGGLCEAIGVMYGLEPDKRCNAPLGKGRQHDHILGCWNGGDNSLENCAAICIPCHAFKTAKIDIPRAAKTVRIRDKHTGVKRYSRPIPGSRASGIRKRMNGNVERWS